MGLFSAMFGGNLGRGASSGDLGHGDASYEQSELLGVYRNLSYSDCQDLFRFWPLGKRVIEALPNFAMSVPRSFTFKEGPDDLSKRFEETCLEYNVDKLVRKTAIYTRLYGMAALFIASKDESIQHTDAIDYEAATKGFTFNALDPLSMGANIQVDLDPLSATYQQPIHVHIKGHRVNPRRICITYNDVPLYLKFNPSTFAFTGASVFQNMTLVIRSINRSLIALQRAATKAGSIIRTTKEVAHNSGITQMALAKNNEMIRTMENDGIAAIGSGESVTFFDLNGVQGVDAIINQLNSILMMALADTPTGILLDKNLSFGLNDGTEDMKAILMAVDHFRESILKPLYNFVDEFILAAAFNKVWIVDFMKEYPDLYRGKSPEEVFEQIRNDYEFKFGDLYPLNENEQEDVNAKKLANLAQLSGLGVTRADIETLLNQSNLYNLDFTLEEPVDQSLEGGFGDGDSEEDSGDSEVVSEYNKENETREQSITTGDTIQKAISEEQKRRFKEALREAK